MTYEYMMVVGADGRRRGRGLGHLPQREENSNWLADLVADQPQPIGPINGYIPPMMSAMPPGTQAMPAQQLQPIAEQPGWLTEEQAAADTAEHGRSEARSMIQYWNELIARVRAGDQEAMRSLQDAVSHHDTLESIEGCAEFEAGRGTSTPIERELYSEYCSTMRLAQAVAAGRDPRRTQIMVVVGVGMAVVAAGAIYWAVTRR